MSSAAGGVTRAWGRAIERSAELTARDEATLFDVVEDWAAAGAGPALLGETEQLRFPDLAGRARRYARWALTLGLGPGDVVALMAANRPDYVAAWLGIGRSGAVVSLLNTHLRGEALAHVIGVSRPSHLIVDETFVPAVVDLAEAGAQQPRIWRPAELEAALAAASAEPLTVREAPPPDQARTALHIFTSGTTGLPKAARISHRRMMSWSGWFAGLLDVTPQDRLYNCLPLYHSVGGVAAIGAALVGGGSVVVREKFSAARFWADIADTDCTLFQYIGELCRYLLATAPNPNERRHKLRLMCGNGLRGDVWTTFQERFGVPRVLEFYAATEGTFSLFNVEGRPGAIGRVPPFLSHRFPAAVVRLDADTQAPLRGPDGLCVRCAPDEAGEAIGKVAPQGAGAAAFEGYTDPAASEAKLLRDVFEAGDMWFRSGDLMRKDKAGFFYFVDRIGDTFRWKGENVATAEVEGVLAACPGVKDAAVFGVAIPGAEGRAGMAALATGSGFDLAALPAWSAARLPRFAWPVLVRLMEELPLTETFKLKKQLLAREGFAPAAVGEGRVYLLDPATGGYAPLEGDLYAKLSAGELRL